MEIKIDGLVKSYAQRRVVNGVSLNIKNSEIVGLLGPNGAGKTTTFHIIVGLVKADSGSIFFNSENIINFPVHQRARRGIVYLSQEASIFRGLTVWENIMAVLEMLSENCSPRIHSGVSEANEEKCESLLKQLNVYHLKDRHTHNLSGGERRRVEIARALAINPKFILLDEPFVGIDPITVSDIQGIISELKKSGIGVVLTDHNVRHALEIIDRAYIIYDGKILIEGTARQLLESDEARKIYLGEKFKM
ncbi:MAG: LPS export ABC transporter ATP-binding protein [Elusimicrobiota bacterium]|nr:LPS export ABC transporter ATP-binding protein [Elusimicrobiota bacterium]